MAPRKIIIRNYRPEDAQDLANIFYNTIHRINIQDYTQEQIAVWAPETSLDGKGGKRNLREQNRLW